MPSNANIFPRLIDNATMQTLPIEDGNLIFNTDDKVIYLDNEGQRLRYGGTVVVDNKFSDTSTNPLQNKVVSSLIKTIKLSLSKDSWSSEAPFSQTLSINGMTNKGLPNIFLALSETLDEANDKLKEKNFGFISYYKTENNMITFYCKYKKPTVDLPILVEGIY